MSNVLVGVNYFAGWWEPHPNKWHRYANDTEPRDWRLDYPERVPLLGCMNDQATMDAEIPAAADHGVDFFPILWYFNDPGTEREASIRTRHPAIRATVTECFPQRKYAVTATAGRPGGNRLPWIQGLLTLIEYPSTVAIFSQDKAH